MIISDEQLARVVEYVKTGCASPCDCAATPASLTPEFEARIRSSMESAPDIRTDRMEAAKLDLARGSVTSEDVAAKVIARAVSDSIR